MYPQIAEIYPLLYPHIPPDARTLLRTLMHQSKPLPIGKKKKAARLWNCAAF